MANILIPEELNALIQQYLTDGVLTDKERQVILNEAEKMGLNREKIDLILDAEVQKIDQQTDAAVRKQKGKTCPYCGGSVPQLTDKCPHCGENITPETSEELQEILDNLEEALVNLKSGKNVNENKANVERYMRKAEMYYSNNPKIKKLLEHLNDELSEAERLGKTAARNAAISQAASSTAKGIGSSIKFFLLNHKIAVIVIILVIGVLYFVKMSIDVGLSLSDPNFESKEVREERNGILDNINDAIKNGDISSAIVAFGDYTKRFGVSNELKSKIFTECLKKNMLDDALSLCDQYDSGLLFQICDKYIEQGNYKQAEACLDKSASSSDTEYADFMTKCVVHMKENGEIAKARSFIKSHLHKIGREEDRQETKQQLMELLEE